MTTTGVIILAHGSRGERGARESAETLEKLTHELVPLLALETRVMGATLQFNHPTLEEAASAFIDTGVEHVVVVPYFLFNGLHLTEHIPECLDRLRGLHPGTQFILANNLGWGESFVSLVAKRISEVAPHLMHTSSPAISNSIEKESMKVLGVLLPSLTNLSEEETAIVKRIVHACGDIEVAPLVMFSKSAVSSGLHAIRNGKRIITDVRMVLAGIDRHLCGEFGCLLSCALDELGGMDTSEERQKTRTALAMSSLGAKLGGAVVVIGNAPTALMELTGLIDGGIRPALVVGMPVGFVQAKESKEELVKRDVPFITVVGTRGGSPMAAATVNALLRLAAARQDHDDARSIKSNMSGGVR